MIQMERFAKPKKTTPLDAYKFIPWAEPGYCNGVSVSLPAEYGAYIKALDKNHSEKFRKDIEDKANALLTGTLAPNRRLCVGWYGGRGAYFNFEDATEVFIDGFDTMLSRYTSHNIDSSQEQLELLAALTLYMRRVMANALDSNPDMKMIYKAIPDAIGGDRGWEVTVKLPEGCASLLPKIAGGSIFRAAVENDLKGLFNGVLKNEYININWAKDGTASFRTNGNACEVIPGPGLEYESFNIDTPRQAFILFTCLVVYSRHTMRSLANEASFSGAPAINKVISTTLNFDREGNFETELAHEKRIAKEIRRGHQELGDLIWKDRPGSQ